MADNHPENAIAKFIDNSRVVAFGKNHKAMMFVAACIASLTLSAGVMTVDSARENQVQPNQYEETVSENPVSTPSVAIVNPYINNQPEQSHYQQPAVENSVMLKMTSNHSVISVTTDTGENKIVFIAQDSSGPAESTADGTGIVFSLVGQELKVYQLQDGNLPSDKVIYERSMKGSNEIVPFAPSYIKTADGHQMLRTISTDGNVHIENVVHAERILDAAAQSENTPAYAGGISTVYEESQTTETKSYPIFHRVLIPRTVSPSYYRSSAPVTNSQTAPVVRSPIAPAVPETHTSVTETHTSYSYAPAPAISPRMATVVTETHISSSGFGSAAEGHSGGGS